MESPIIQRVRHELKLRELVVAAVVPVSPGFVSIRFTGEALADFVSLSFDDHVKLMFDDAGGEPVRRDYTPRSYSREAQTLTIEFALHGDGKASDWARTARVGQRLLVGGPRGSMIVPFEFSWHLLVGDASALPAIARRLEELPHGARVVVFALAGEADRRALDSDAEVDRRWFANPAELLSALRTLDLPGAATGFAWGGGEASLMGQVREILLQRGVPRQHMRISAYWKRGARGHHEQLE